MTRSRLVWLAVLAFSCTPKPASKPWKPGKPYWPEKPPVVVEKRVPVMCMDKPPVPVFPTWPDADRVGTVVMHASTVDAFKDGIYALQAFIASQYLKCYRAAREGLSP